MLGQMLTKGAAVGEIVVGVDGSEGSGRALDWAAAEARLRGETLTVVHAWDIPAAIAATTVLPHAQSWTILEAAADAVLKAMVARAEALGVHPHEVLVQGCYPCTGHEEWITITIENHDQWRSLCRACSPALPGCNRFPPESCQNTFGGFQLIELSTQLFSFDIEPLEPLGNSLLLLSHQPSHLSGSPLSQVRPPCAGFSDE